MDKPKDDPGYATCGGRLMEGYSPSDFVRDELIAVFDADFLRSCGIRP